MSNGQRTREATKDFWTAREQIAADFEAGKDEVAQAIETLNAPPETVVES